MIYLIQIWTDTVILYYADTGDIMKKKIFGNSIAPSCAYCEHSKTEGTAQFCDAHKSLKNGKCRKFRYNPIMREPKGMAPLRSFSKEDFTL